MIGTTVGKYRVLARLGRGGMGIVYKALDETLDREVAIKVLNPDVTDAELLKRFRAEAVSLARLNHPGIATIYELHRHNDDLLMVMEFVRGVTLQSLSERLGPLEPQQAAHICVQILDALGHAHRAGIVHRDLKPANVMVSDTGSVKIMDFGIARVLGGEHYTHAGFMMGTPAYMAPEQVLGREIDGRADLYSVGVLFYRLLSRELPFKADTAIAMAQKQVADAPTPLGTFRPDLPLWCEPLITKALAKAPAERYQSAEEFRAAILAAVTPEPIGDLPTMATPVPAGVLKPSDVTSSFVGAPAPAVRAGTETVPDETVVAPPGAPGVSTGTTPRTGASSPLERTGTTVVLGRGHLIALAAVLLVLIGGIAILGIVALTRGGATAPEAAATPGDATSPPAAPPETTSDQPPATATEDVSATTSQPEAPKPELSSPPATPAPPSPPAADTPVKSRRATDSAAKTAKPDPTTAPAALQPLPLPPVAEAARVHTPVAPPLIAFKEMKVLVAQGDSLRERDAVFTLDAGRLTVTERNGTTEIVSLPYSSIAQAFFSRSKHPRWIGPDGKEVEASVDLGRMSFFRGERNWLILTTSGSPVFVRFEDAHLQAALAAFQERTGIKIQRQAADR